jgi:nitric oxide reductase activation protein
LDELEDASAKVVREAVGALPDLERRIGLELVVPWLDLAVALTLSSGATAIRYLRESPLLLGLLPPETRQSVLAAVQEMAEQDANVALEMVRNAPELLRVAPQADLAAWGGMGEDLARVDYVVAVEFLRQSPATVGLLPWDRLHAWVQLGMGLITQNSFGKPDYLATLEFFRRSASILGDIEEADDRGIVIEIGALLCRQSSQQAMAWIADAPRILRAIPRGEWQRKALQYGGLVADRDAEAALAYFRRVPEVLSLLGEGADLRTKFDDWFKGAMEVLAYSVEGARAYFAAETRKALASIEQALNGVALRQVARQLKLFAQALCGRDLCIQALPDPAAPDKEPARASVSPDGYTIFLPPLIRRTSSHEANLRLYTVMTAHEAGHLEYGTYSLSFERLADLMATVRARYGRPSEPPVTSLSDLFRLYPQPLLVRDLWLLLEDARVESRLRREYPGLGQDLAELAREAVKTRSLNHGMTARELIVDCLLLMTTADSSSLILPEVVRDIVGQLWAECQTLFRADATAADAVRLADRLYVRLEEWAKSARAQSVEGQTVESSGTSMESPTAAETLTDQYRPVENWKHRGAMDPSQVVDQRVEGASSSKSGDQAATAGKQPRASAGGEQPSRRQVAQAHMREPAGTAGEQSPVPDSLSERLLAVKDDRDPVHVDDQAGERIWAYDEWDGRIQDYRPAWCLVRERIAADHTMDFAEEVLCRHGAASVRTLRRSFERMKPPGLRTVHGARDGDGLDWEAVVRRRADLAAGVEPTDDVYLRREKRERDVAVVFLVDLSGSTSRQLEGEGRRVIDVEKEGLVLLCEALDALGDQYAVYGYSGQGRAHVDFLVFKDFDERGRATARLGAATPLRQNRDGAAIRHAARKLLSRSAKTKVLILISDGRPLDEGYADEYSLEDTKMALREVRTQGIHPFCLTVDQAADAYVKRMYGDVHFLVLDDARHLPERLPRVYQRLTA